MALNTMRYKQGNAMTNQITIQKIAQNAKTASRNIATASTDDKNLVLDLVANSLITHKNAIYAENQKDIKAAEQKNMSSALLDRLTINENTLEAMVTGLQDVIALNDPVGEITKSWQRPNGINISKKRIPLGVIAMIYESRPNVTIDAAALCLKSGNACILRGGSEAFFSNKILGQIIQQAMKQAGLNENIVQILPIKEHEAITYLLSYDELIDLVIPRGGEALIRFVVQNSTIPVLKHYKGVCHAYIDKDADIDQAVNICLNSKAQRPGVCNAMETLLVHRDIADRFLPIMAERFSNVNVELKGCDETLKILPHIAKANEDDWNKEYLDLILSVKIVDSIKEAMNHIAEFGSDHTDIIVTSNQESADQFVKNVDSSMVGVNVSTRFNDGGELGLGAEIGISTSKLHAFGPMGLEELTTTKFVVTGNGQIRN